MAEPKPIASLSSSLLARKGHAKPAMRPQGFAGMGFGAPQALEDLGWNDMGGEATPAPARASAPATAAPPRVAEVVPIVPTAEPASASVEPPLVHRQQEEIARVMTPHAPEPAPIDEAGDEPDVGKAHPAQHERRRDDHAREAVERATTIRAMPGSKGKAAFTLRLDPARHLKLRLAGAVAHRSSQAIVLEALDAYLSTQPRVLELADEAAQRSVATHGPGDAR